MKTYKLLLVCSFCLVALSLFGQRDETLFSRIGGLSGAWISPTYGHSAYGNDWVYSYGVHGGLEFGRTFYLGWGSFSTKEDVNVEGIDPFRMRYDGLIIGVTPGANRLLHPRFNFLIGGGNLLMESGRDKVFVFRPSVGVELNVFRWFRMGLEGGYRFVRDRNSGGFESSDLSTPFIQLDLRFGSSWR